MDEAASPRFEGRARNRMPAGFVQSPDRQAGGEGEDAVNRTRVAIVGAISGLVVLASGTVGFGLGRDGGPTTGIPSGTAGGGPAGSTAAAGVASVASVAPAVTTGVAAGRAAAPFPGPDFPGLPPFPSQAPEADGVHAVGVAYRQTDDPGARAGRDLVRQAFEDATSKARELADAAGVKLGTLVGLSDVKQTQPFYKECFKPLQAPGAEAKPAAPDTPLDAPSILPAPVPDCSPTWYVVAWVFVRYELA
jgi:uncharacterized protein DUF541